MEVEVKVKVIENGLLAKSERVREKERTKNK